ncbi:general odorant-binding protein 19a-like [Anabrus simplex]|uniref:general odorant-binding protein 19a-like n=1 Tax=Anabrus simplex TaxID=316456 RepID=UPI0035A3158B
MDVVYIICREQHKICEEEEKDLAECKIPESRDGKCFVGCCFQEMALITNGKFNKTSCQDQATDIYGEDKDELERVMGVIDKCEQEVTGNDICDNGPLLMSCIKNHGEGLFIPYPGMKFE